MQSLIERFEELMEPSTGHEITDGTQGPADSTSCATPLPRMGSQSTGALANVQHARNSSSADKLRVHFQKVRMPMHVPQGFKVQPADMPLHLLPHGYHAMFPDGFPSSPLTRDLSGCKAGLQYTSRALHLPTYRLAGHIRN